MRVRTDGWSLRIRLLSIAALAVGATLIVGAASMHIAANDEDQKMLDSRLVDLAQTVLSFSEHEINEVRAEGRLDRVHIETAATLGSRYRYQIWSPKGELMLRSVQATFDRPMVPLGHDGFSTVTIGGEDFRVFSLQAPDQALVIQVAECLDDRESEFLTIVRRFVTALALPFALILGLTWWLLRRSLRAIDSSAAQLSERSSIDLTPIEVKQPPQELRPMIDSINALLERTQRTLSMERGFTSVAAHELRTPLAGLRAQAQIASTATSQQELQESLTAVMSCVDRVGHLLDQLLDLARVESLTLESGSRPPSVDVERMYNHVMVEYDPIARNRDVRVESKFAAKELPARELGVLLLLRNLVGNAIRYTPAGGGVQVSTERDEDSYTLTVDDSGPGIPPESRQKVFERFQRLGRLDDGGVGLGMSIVQSVVEVHRATIRLLDSPLGGLRVQVRFSATPA